MPVIIPEVVLVLFDDILVLFANSSNNKYVFYDRGSGVSFIFISNFGLCFLFLPVTKYPEMSKEIVFTGKQLGAKFAEFSDCS